MAIRMLCPNGHELVTEDHYAGRKVRCPHCQLLLVVPMPRSGVTAKPPGPAPEPQFVEDLTVVEEETSPAGSDDELTFLDDEEERPGKRRRASREVSEDAFIAQKGNLPIPKKSKRKPKKGLKLERKQFAMVNLGLLFHYIKIIGYLLGVLLYAIAGILGMAGVGTAVGGEGSTGAGIATLGFFIGLLALLITLIVAPLLGLVGSIFCCWVPEKTGGRVLIIISLALDVLPAVLFVVMLLVTAATLFTRDGGPMGGGLAIVLQVFSAGVSLAAWVLFMLFMRAVAYYFEEETTGNEAVSACISYLLWLIPGFIGMMGAVIVLSLFLPCVGLVFSLILLFGWIWMMTQQIFRVLNVIGSLRQILRSRLGV